MQVFIDLLMYLMAGGIFAWIFYYPLRKALLGGFWGAFIVAVLGAIIGHFLLNTAVSVILEYLENGLNFSNVNLITAFLGAFISIYVFNKINHDRTRD